MFRYVAARVHSPFMSSISVALAAAGVQVRGGSGSKRERYISYVPARDRESLAQAAFKRCKRDAACRHRTSASAPTRPPPIPERAQKSISLGVGDLHRPTRPGTPGQAAVEPAHDLLGSRWRSE